MLTYSFGINSSFRDIERKKTLSPQRKPKESGNHFMLLVKAVSAAYLLHR